MTIELNGVLELNGTTNLTFDNTNQHIFVYPGGEIHIRLMSWLLPYGFTICNRRNRMA